MDLLSSSALLGQQAPAKSSEPRWRLQGWAGTLALSPVELRPSSTRRSGGRHVVI